MIHIIPVIKEQIRSSWEKNILTKWVSNLINKNSFETIILHLKNDCSKEKTFRKSESYNSSPLDLKALETHLNDFLGILLKSKSSLSVLFT